MANYLIVGGSKGIGQRLALDLSKDHSVDVVARNSSSELPSSVNFNSLDVSEDTYSYEGEVLDGLVYCPGTINLKPFNRLKNKDFLEDLQLNLMGAINHIQANLDKLKKSESGSIILFSTVAVSQGMPFHTSVAASKGAIEGLARSLAAELAPSVRVNVIAPSITDTPLASKLLSSDEKKEKSGDRHPLKRVGEVSDISSMAKFLLSPESSWITGQIMHVDGGMSSIRSL